MTSALKQLLDEDPDLKIIFVKPTVPQIVGSMMDGLNYCVYFISMTQCIDKHNEMVLNHAFHGLSEETFNEVLDHLVYFDFSRLKQNAYANLLARIPTDSRQYGRIKGSMMFELCKHLSYTDALNVLKLKDK